MEHKGAVKNGVGKLRISQPFALQKTASEKSVFGAALRQPGVCLVKELTKPDILLRIDNIQYIEYNDIKKRQQKNYYKKGK